VKFSYVSTTDTRYSASYVQWDLLFLVLLLLLLLLIIRDLQPICWTLAALFSFLILYTFYDRLSGLVIGISGYRSRSLGSIHGATRFCLERGPFSLESTIEELLERKSSGFGTENQEYGRRNPSRWPRGTFYPQNLALTSNSGGCLVGIVCSQTQATVFLYTVCRTPWAENQTVVSALLHTGQYKLNKCTQVSMSRVGFETTNTELERAKTFKAIGCTATVIDLMSHV
jgi:hypothetical protein